MLGIKLYSQFLMRCWKALDRVLMDLEWLEVYQYVGDGVILTWEKLEQTTAALNVFYDFQTILEQQQVHFERDFSCQPIFKTTASIGEMVEAFIPNNNKPTKAFYGYAISITARLQSFLSTYQETLLVSKNVISCIDKKALKIEFLCESNVKGLQNPIAVYAISRQQVY